LPGCYQSRSTFDGDWGCPSTRRSTVPAGIPVAVAPFVCVLTGVWLDIHQPSVALYFHARSGQRFRVVTAKLKTGRRRTPSYGRLARRRRGEKQRRHGNCREEVDRRREVRRRPRLREWRVIPAGRKADREVKWKGWQMTKWSTGHDGGRLRLMGEYFRSGREEPGKKIRTMKWG